MKKILFLIPNLKHGGAEKVLVNLVNNLSRDKYDITVQTLFDEGVHRDSLKPHIRYIPGFQKSFRGNSLIAKILPVKFLWKRLVKEHYDIVVSYLEGPTSRILGGCTDFSTMKVAWVHTELISPKKATIGFRNHKEACRIYNSFQHIVAVSKNVKNSIIQNLNINTPISVLYNTNETEQILQLSKVEPKDTTIMFDEDINVCTVGRLIRVKGFERLINVHKRLLNDGLYHKLYIIGTGEEQNHLASQIRKLGVEDTVFLIGFQTNPYQYISRCDLYVCSSYREGFSTAVTESLIVGTAVVSTDCSGAKELLGESNEYGIVVENSEKGLYSGMKDMLSDPSKLIHYTNQANIRGSYFSREQTVKAVEEMLDSL